MTAPTVSRRFFHTMRALRLWSLFVGFWKAYECIVPPSKHITLDGIDGGAPRPYLTRWHVIPRNRWLNIYLHRFEHGDDDRALHDHPWHSASLILEGRYIEHTAEYLPRVPHDVGDIDAVKRRVVALHARFYPGDGRRYVEGSLTRNRDKYEGFDRFDYTQPFIEGDFRKFPPTHRHLIQLYGNNAEPCLTLFLTGLIVRRWGFWCPKGWRDYEDYLAPHPTIPNTTLGCEDAGSR